MLTVFITEETEDWKSPLKNVQHQWKYLSSPQIVFISWGKKQK